jgi:tetratricopeptide (TPR) repeat protein
MASGSVDQRDTPPRQSGRVGRAILSVRSKLSGYRSALSRPTPRLVIALTALFFIVVAMFFFTSYAYERMSPLTLRFAAIAKWVIAGVVALAAAWVLFESRKSESARTTRAISVVALMLTIFLQLGLEPPPKFSVQELRALKQFNAEFDGVRITPDLERIAEAVELSEETDPLRLGQSKLARGKLEEALALFDKSLGEMQDLEKVIAETHFYKAVSLSRLGREQEAIAEAELAHAILPRMSIASALKCRSLRRLQRFAEALPICELAIDEDPTNGWAWSEKGGLLIEMGMREMDRKKHLFEDGIVASDIAIKLLPKNPRAWNNKAVALRRLGRLREAIDAADKALALQPGFADALLNKATALRHMGRLDEAATIYQKMTSESPYDPEAWNNLGDIYEEKGEYDKALTFYSAAVQQRSNYADGWYNKGHMLNLLSRYAEAAVALGRAVELNDQDDEAYFQQAVAFVHLGQRAKAIQSLDKSLSLNPDSKDARELRSKAERLE